MAVVLAAVAGLVLGTAPSECACGLPGYSLNTFNSLCTDPTGTDICTPASSLCPNAVTGRAPPCIGDSLFTSSLGLGGNALQRSSASLGFMYPGEPLWLSQLQSHLVTVPSFMEGLPMWTSSHMLPSNTVVRQVCPSSSRVPGCRFYVFVYDCQTNCKPDSDLSVLASVLVPLGYEISHCAPSFRQYANGQVHGMKAFVKLVARGHSETFETTTVVRHMMTSIDRFAHDCSSFDQVECILPGVVDCKVDPSTNACVNALCPLAPSFQGPLVPGSCGVCPSQEGP